MGIGSGVNIGSSEVSLVVVVSLLVTADVSCGCIVLLHPDRVMQQRISMMNFCIVVPLLS